MRTSLPQPAVIWLAVRIQQIIFCYGQCRVARFCKTSFFGRWKFQSFQIETTDLNKEFGPFKEDSFKKGTFLFVIEPKRCLIEANCIQLGSKPTNHQALCDMSGDVKVQ